MQTPMRRYPFPHIANFRDLGGYPADGGMTRWGVFFRSARLSQATGEELDAIKALGIRTVIDLRMDEEVDMRPDAGMDDPELGFHHLSLMRESNMSGQDVDELMKHPDTVPPMSTLYQVLLEEGPDLFRSLFALMASRVQAGGVLFHCTAGKDRTGLTAMMLLSLCGVSELDIIADYEVSRTYNHPFMPEDTTGSRPKNMVKTIDYLEKEYGGPIGYLRKVGVTQDELDVLRGALMQKG